MSEETKVTVVENSASSEGSPTPAETHLVSAEMIGLKLGELEAKINALQAAVERVIQAEAMPGLLEASLSDLRVRVEEVRTGQETQTAKLSQMTEILEELEILHEEAEAVTEAEIEVEPPPATEEEPEKVKKPLRNRLRRLIA